MIIIWKSLYYTDSQNLTFLKESPSRKIQRWRLALQMFTFSSIHIQGELNVEADSLSRIFCPALL